MVGFSLLFPFTTVISGVEKLDRGLFGPSEPWGMSWQGEPKKGIPRFSDIAFYVDRNIENILIDTRTNR